MHVDDVLEGQVAEVERKVVTAKTLKKTKKMVKAWGQSVKSFYILVT